MNIKKTYVYKSIRMAALQRIFSPSMFFFYLCFAFLVIAVRGLLFEFNPSQNQHMLFPIFFFILFLLFYVVSGVVDWIQCVITIISPEKSETAKQYREYISFEDMCLRVESQYLWPLYHLEHQWLCPLKEFIIYEHYGAFFVIPYSAIQEIVPWIPLIESSSGHSMWRTAVAIQDTLSHCYRIVCDGNDEKEEILYILNDLLQKARENGGHL